MATNKVMGNDYRGWTFEVINGQPVIVDGTRKKGIILNKDTVESVQIVSEEQKKNLGKTIGLGIVGGIAVGPLGLLAGALGGSRKEICFICEFWDGTKFLAVTDPKTFQKVMASTL